MITNYEADISHWERWEQEYRYGLLLIVPPDPLRSQVDALRSEHDPRSQAACGAHISLSAPLPRGLSREDWAELEAIAAGIEPFWIRYGPLKHYLPHPGVCLAIEPQQPLDALRRRIEAATVFGAAAPRKYPYSAHMTIAEFIDAEQTLELMASLAEVAPEGELLCDRVWYIVPEGAFQFTERAALRLGGSNG